MPVVAGSLGIPSLSILIIAPVRRKVKAFGQKNLCENLRKSLAKTAEWVYNGDFWPARPTPASQKSQPQNKKNALFAEHFPLLASLARVGAPTLLRVEHVGIAAAAIHVPDGLAFPQVQNLAPSADDFHVCHFYFLLFTLLL